MNSVTVTPEPVKNPSSIRTMIGILIGLVIVAAVVWMTRPVPENYQPPPVQAKSIVQVEQEIARVKQDSGMSAAQKARILGYLQHDMENAKKFGGK